MSPPNKHSTKQYSFKKLGELGDFGDIRAIQLIKVVLSVKRWGFWGFWGDIAISFAEPEQAKFNNSPAPPPFVGKMGKLGGERQ